MKKRSADGIMRSYMGSGTLRRVWRYARWVLLALVLAWVALAVYRVPAVEQQKQSAEMVAYIESQKITMDDVDGKHLPQPPDPKHKDSTIQGIDANQNGIRDDVELAIFAKYPNDIRLRAAALQYAMTEQMFLTSVFDPVTWKAVAEQDARASSCLSETYPRTDLKMYLQTIEARSSEIESLVFNTPQRKAAQETADKFTTSYGSASGQSCDVLI